MLLEKERKFLRGRETSSLFPIPTNITVKQTNIQDTHSREEKRITKSFLRFVSRKKNHSPNHLCVLLGEESVTWVAWGAAIYPKTATPDNFVRSCHCLDSNDSGMEIWRKPWKSTRNDHISNYFLRRFVLIGGYMDSYNGLDFSLPILLSTRWYKKCNRWNSRHLLFFLFFFFCNGTKANGLFVAFYRIQSSPPYLSPIQIVSNVWLEFFFFCRYQGIHYRREYESRYFDSLRIPLHIHMKNVSTIR